jgi:hypothetical protein
MSDSAILPLVSVTLLPDNINWNEVLDNTFSIFTFWLKFVVPVIVIALPELYVCAVEVITVTTFPLLVILLILLVLLGTEYVPYVVVLLLLASVYVIVVGFVTDTINVPL